MAKGGNRQYQHQREERSKEIMAAENISRK
jgi:hypothetical protein